MKRFLALIYTIELLFNLDVVKSQQCGIPKMGTKNIAERIIGGSFIEHGQYPWSSVIMKLVKEEPKYHGGGTLISDKFVITAAHCILEKDEKYPLLPRDLLIVIGAHNLDMKFEVGRETKNAFKLHIHPDWNQYLKTFDADIAMIEFEIPVTFSNYIQPICLWESNFEPPQSSGIVVGYGKSEDQSKKHENIPKVIEMPIQEQKDCISKSPPLKLIASGRTFCAGSADGTGVCLGDSGSGFVVKLNNVHYLKGIVSSSLVKDYSCDVHNYEIFTNVLKFKNWIKSFVFKSSQNNLGGSFPETYFYRNVSYEECGVMNSPSGLIQKGKFSSRTEFPWMASIVDQDNHHLDTSGSLISRKHVLTRASAVGYWNADKTKMKPHTPVSRYKIYLGSLQLISNENVFNVQEIILHPNLKDIDSIQVDNIGIIVLSSLVEFSDFIRPVCLWTFSDDINLIKNLPIFAVGYGRDENGIVTNIRKHAKVTLMDQNQCEKIYSDFKNFLNVDKTFCVSGNENGSPCALDECLFIKLNGKWFLRGILLRMFFYANGNCAIGPQWPFIYHDIVQNLEWIQIILNQ